VSALVDRTEQGTQRKRVYADYSLDFKLEALAQLEANSFNYTKTAKELAIDRQLLWSWHRRDEVGGAHARLLTAKKEELARKWEERTHAALEALTDEKLAAASARDLGIVAGVGTDKTQLLRGESTQIVGHVEAKQSAEDALSTLYELARQEAEKRGQIVTLDQVRTQLIAHKPELKALLTQGGGGADRVE
jgi:hypothetical protein